MESIQISNNLIPKDQSESEVEEEIKQKRKQGTHYDKWQSLDYSKFRKGHMLGNSGQLVSLQDDPYQSPFKSIENPIVGPSNTSLAILERRRKKKIKPDLPRFNSEIKVQKPYDTPKRY